jgi:hypothetical protein
VAARRAKVETLKPTAVTDVSFVGAVGLPTVLHEVVFFRSTRDAEKTYRALA